MESDIKKDPKAHDGNEAVAAGDDLSVRLISELSKALDVVTNKFSLYRRKLRRQIVFWGILCTLIIAGCIILSKVLLNEKFPDVWTWQVGYVSVIRITIATAIFSLGSFCFKILRSYIHLNEHNTHCITVISSMANLVGAAKDETQRNLIYTRLIDIVISFGETGLLSTLDDIKGMNTVALDSFRKLFDNKS